MNDSGPNGFLSVSTQWLVKQLTITWPAAVNALDWQNTGFAADHDVTAVTSASDHGAERSMLHVRSRTIEDCRTHVDPTDGLDHIGTYAHCGDRRDLRRQ